MRHYLMPDGQLMNRHKKTTGVRRQSASGIKKRAHTRTHTLMWPATNHRHSMLPQTLNVQCIRPNIPTEQNKHTLLHSTLKDQSRPSPRIQDHTVAAVGGSLDWGGRGERRRRKGGRKMWCDVETKRGRRAK